MSDEKPRIGVTPQGEIVWHVDELGHFHWGSPQGRAEGFEKEDTDKALNTAFFERYKAREKTRAQNRSGDRERER